MNIWTPSNAQSLPVMVWIHGGGDAGSAQMSDPNSGGSGKKLSARGMVVCTIDFRQGIFGTMDWGVPEIPTNLELRDMICALEFIQSHIASFGGNPGNVTIVGESIGGRRVCELMSCSAAAGLFHRAIATSPSLVECCNTSQEHQQYRTSLVREYLNLGGAEKPLTKARLNLSPNPNPDPNSDTHQGDAGEDSPPEDDERPGGRQGGTLG